MSNKAKKSWQEKLKDNKGLPKVAKITPKMAGRWGTKLGDTVAIPAPMEVDEIIRKVPKGKLITINEIRTIVAKKHKATVGCPIVCGISAWISANAAEEARAEGKKNLTPWWRTLKSGGELNEKYPGSGVLQAKFLKKEGHTIVKKGKKYLVVDFEKHLAKL